MPAKKCEQAVNHLLNNYYSHFLPFSCTFSTKRCPGVPGHPYMGDLKKEDWIRQLGGMDGGSQGSSAVPLRKDRGKKEFGLEKHILLSDDSIP